MTGILATLKYRHLQFEYMTPIERYQTLSQTLYEMRGANFEIYMQGVDELIMSLGTVLFEACNTSFQLHLQIRPEAFVDQHNWSQMIAGPVLSICTNSPLLFGQELWEESRISIFKQSLDTRSSHKFIRKKMPRVYFGKGWLQHSPAELWKSDLMRFPLVVTSDQFDDAMACIENNQMPNLRAIRLHNGTTYTWNRMCYGLYKNQAHLRIECRYLPSGPSALDEISNFAFWIGLMQHGASDGPQFWQNQDFKIAKNNFIKSARTGMNTVFQWYGKNIPAQQLILEHLLPMAAKGLSDSGVNSKDADRYLSTIEQRVASQKTGSDWAIKSYRALSRRYGDILAQNALVNQMVDYQKDNIPVHQWKYMDSKSYATAHDEVTVEQIMTRDIFTINEEDSIEMFGAILKWNNIHHLPVENDHGDLVGLITDGMMARLSDLKKGQVKYAKDIMLKSLISIKEEESVVTAVTIMKTNNISCVPVVFGKKLTGILTLNDLKKLPASPI
jgi:CBS domain-containing protein